MSRSIISLAVGIFMCIATGIVLPDTAAVAGTGSKIVEEVGPQETVSGMSRKAVRGLSNIALGWIELPKQVYVTYKNDGAATGLSMGPLKGIGMTLVRTVTGVAEFVTFFYPLPGFYDPYFEPEFVWQPE